MTDPGLEVPVARLVSRQLATILEYYISGTAEQRVYLENELREALDPRDAGPVISLLRTLAYGPRRNP